MNNGPKRFMFGFACFGIFLLMFSSCQNMGTGAGAIPPALKVLDAKIVTSKDAACSSIVEEETEAWQSRDVEQIKQVYSADVIHFDGGPAFVGIDEVANMAENMWIYFPKWEMRAGEVYISEDRCFGEWENWNIFGFLATDPAVEYDWLEFNDQGVYFWRLFYDQKFQDKFRHPERIDTVFLNDFVQTWSGQKSKKISAIYAQGAHIEDTLFGLNINGANEIKAFADSFQAQFPHAAWRLIDAFGEESAGPDDKEEYPYTYQGGIMEIELPGSGSGSCTIRVAVLLAPDAEGKIVSQKMFYEPQSLINCGLAQ